MTTMRIASPRIVGWVLFFSTIWLGCSRPAPPASKAEQNSPPGVAPTAAATAKTTGSALDPAVALRNLQGQWKVVSGTFDGKTRADLLGFRLTFRGNQFEAVAPDGRGRFLGEFRIHPDASPPGLDMIHREGPDKGKTFLGVFEATATRLRLCDNGGDANKPRPTNFDGGAGSAVAVFLFEKSPDPVEAQPGVDADQTDRRKLQGAWRVADAMRNGKPAEDVVGRRLSFTDDRFEVSTAAGETLYRGKVILQPARLVKQIDFVHEFGPEKGRRWLGVYTLEGDSLRICDNAAGPDEPRPSSFDSHPGSGIVALTFQREKP